MRSWPSAGAARRLRSEARALNVPLAFGDYRDLLAHPEVDLVTVAVKVTHHREMAEAALKSDKMVYSEWPLGRNAAEAAELSALAAASHLRTVIGLQGRFSPAIQFVRELVSAGEIGRVLGTSIRGIGPDSLWHGTLDPAFEITADVTNGNTLLAIPVGHVLDMLAFVLGEFASVGSVLAVGRSQAIRSRDGAKIPVTAHDQIAIAGTLVSGALASLHYHGGAPHGPTFDWQINGSEGDLRIVAPQGYGNINALEGQGGYGGGTWKTLEVLEPYRKAPVACPEAVANIYAVYAQFADDLRTGTKLAPDFADGLRRHMLLEAIEVAHTTGERQTLPQNHTN